MRVKLRVGLFFLKEILGYFWLGLISEICLGVVFFECFRNVVRFKVYF